MWSGAGRGWTPGICLPHPSPDPHQAARRALGLRVLWAGPGRADGSAPTAPVSRGCSQGALQTCGPWGKGPGGRLGHVCRGSKVLSEGQQAGASVRGHPPSPAARPRPHPHPPGPATTHPQLVSSIVVPRGPLRWRRGACSVVSERTPWSGPGGRVGSGRGAGQPLPVPSACPPPPQRPALIGLPFLLSFNIFIPAFQMRRKVP